MSGLTNHKLNLGWVYTFATIYFIHRLLKSDWKSQVLVLARYVWEIWQFSRPKRCKLIIKFVNNVCLYFHIVRKGAIVGVEVGSDSVTKSVNKLLDAGVPIAGVWMQDWSGNHDYDSWLADLPSLLFWFELLEHILLFWMIFSVESKFYFLEISFDC